MIDDEEESATIARWVMPAARRATYPHPNTVTRPAPEAAGARRRRYGDGALALGTAQTRRAAQPPPIPPPRPPRSVPRASSPPADAAMSASVIASVIASAPTPAAAGDRAAWRWLAALTAIVAALVVGAVAYAIIVLGYAR
jgi:hypothetical protein